MVQPDQLRGSHPYLHLVQHFTFGQGFLRLLRASRLCNDGQQHNRDKEAEFHKAPEDIFKGL